MCGILGSIGASLSRSQFEHALDSLAHRGPDDDGIMVDESRRVFLGHRRLSIIDLSRDGKQPFVDQSGRYQLIYNGEIYNYLELKEELRAHHTFRTKTDTEVLLAAFLTWGPSCLARLNGMFAFAIWDRERATLFAARDRLGEKPFFYSHEGSIFQFASEIKALRHFRAYGVNERIVGQYLYYGFYDHSEETFFDGIRSLPPGHFLTFEKGQCTITRYWDVRDVAEREHTLTPDETNEKLRELVADSLKLRFRSDVPVGINLSSGLDSGVLFSFARHIVGDTLHAFSMCADDPAYNECALIKEETLQGYDLSLWHRSALKPDEFLSRAHALNAIEDQPYGGIPTIAYEKMNALAKEKGITVLLEGQGVDEILGGYRYYRMELIKDLWERKRYASMFEYIRRQKRGSWWENFRKVREATELRSHDYSQDTTKLLEHEVLAPELRKVMKDEPPVFDEPFDSHLKNAQYRDLRYTKLPRVLRFNDHATMAHGRELRLPYLDHRIVEFCFHLPHKYKISFNSQKVLMRKAFQRQLKPSHRERQKTAFGAHQTPWLRQHGEAFVRDLIGSQSFMSRGYWDNTTLRKEVDAFFAGKGDNSFFLWQCINLELWMRAFIDTVPAPVQ